MDKVHGGLCQRAARRARRHYSRSAASRSASRSAQSCSVITVSSPTGMIDVASCSDSSISPDLPLLKRHHFQRENLGFRVARSPSAP